MDLRQFYNEWYEHGYMDDWPAEKKERVFNVIKNLDLPDYGKALDFGCGNGVFTNVLKQALPQWEVYGSDLSTHAVENAVNRYPECTFIHSDSPALKDLQFDFIFSHHVLEHIEDVTNIVALIASMASPNAGMLHILPCGNPRSLEHSLSNWTTDGIRMDKGNTFFFEEEMHLQRFTSQELAKHFEVHGFRKVKAWYANQLYGTLKWVTASSKQFIQLIADPTKGTNNASKGKLWYYRNLFIILYYLQRPAVLYGERIFPLLSLKKIMYNIASTIKRWVSKAENEEWLKHNQKENGSEMYLYLKRAM